MGSDPTIQIETLAKKQKVDCKDVSMGQGQEVHARKLLQYSMNNVSFSPTVAKFFMVV